MPGVRPIRQAIPLRGGEVDPLSSISSVSTSFVRTSGAQRLPCCSPGSQPSPAQVPNPAQSILDQPLTMCSRQSLSQTYVFPLHDLSPLGNSGEKYIASSPWPSHSASPRRCWPVSGPVPGKQKNTPHEQQLARASLLSSARGKSRPAWGGVQGAQPSPVYPRSALNDVLQQTTCKQFAFKSEPLQAKSITNRRLPPPRLASPREFRKKSLSRAPPPIPPRGRKLRPHQTHSLQRKTG